MGGSKRGSFDEEKAKEIKYDDGSVYIGQLKVKRKVKMAHGFGKLYFPDGQMYVGEFKMNMFHGKGVMTHGEGSPWAGHRYEGFYKFDKEEGMGKYTYPSGDSYVGEHRDGKREGKGKFTWKSTGQVYEGAFVDGMAEGFGVMRYADKTVYEGEFIGNLRSGFGKLYNVRGEVEKEGEWVDNTFVGTVDDQSDDDEDAADDDKVGTGQGVGTTTGQQNTGKVAPEFAAAGDVEGKDNDEARDEFDENALDDTLQGKLDMMPTSPGRKPRLKDESNMSAMESFAASASQPERHDEQSVGHSKSRWRNANGSKKIVLPKSQKKRFMHNARWGNDGPMKKAIEKRKVEMHKMMSKATNQMERLEASMWVSDLINCTDDDPGIRLPYPSRKKLGRTALMRAAHYGRSKPVKLLLRQKDIEIDLQDKDSGSTALLLAVDSDHNAHRCFAAILAAGADVNIPRDSDAKSCLSIASEKGQTARVADLLGAGAEIEHQDSEGATALSLAAKGGHTDCMKLLINAGANVNRSNKRMETPLIVATCSGKLDAVALLIDCEAELKNRDMQAKTAMDHCVEKKLVSIENMIVDRVKARRAKELPKIRAAKKAALLAKKEAQRKEKEARRTARTARDSTNDDDSANNVGRVANGNNETVSTPVADGDDGDDGGEEGMLQGGVLMDSLGYKKKK